MIAANFSKLVIQTTWMHIHLLIRAKQYNKVLDFQRFISTVSSRLCKTCVLSDTFSKNVPKAPTPQTWSHD